MPNTIKPLGLGIASRRVLSDVVTDDLRQAIVDHELEPGRRISEDELAAQMGVSRGPIREALARLEREGLITLERHRGARVASWSEQDIDEIYSMRSVLEGLAIEWACKNATVADLAAMDEVLIRYSKLTDKQRTPKEVSKIDLEFHSALFAQLTTSDCLKRGKTYVRRFTHSWSIPGHKMTRLIKNFSQCGDQIT